MLYLVQACQEYQDYSHLDEWEGKSKQHLLLLYGPVHRTIKMQNVLFSFFLMNNQSQRNHWREKSDFKSNHKIISTLIRSHKCRKWKFHYSIFLEHKRMIDSCTVSSAKPYYSSQSCSLFVSLYVLLALPSPHLCCNWKKANYSAGSGDQRNASKKWNWCYNLVESLPMGNKKHVESARPQPKLHLRFYVPSVKDIADHHATSVQF